MPDFKLLRVLIVDDNPDMRQLLRRMLASLGVKDILEATDGQAGIGILSQTGRDVVLSDLDMKPMNGIDFTLQVRSSDHMSNSVVPIIMITGRTELHLVEKARDAGITEFIAKPVNMKALQARLTEIVERPRPFVRSDDYLGPDRRRRAIASRQSRRQSDR
jgi:CheY-like chemotaxis protein